MNIRHFCSMVILLGLCFGVQAQDSPAVLQIREAYKKVNEGIAWCTADNVEFCGWFHTDVAVNEKGDPWPVVGIYQSWQEYWYRPGDMDDEVEGDPNSMNLRFVRINTLRSDRREHEEYLYDSQEHLVFYYFKLENSQEKTLAEHRYYFQDGKLAAYKETVAPEEVEFQQYHKEDAGSVYLMGSNIISSFNQILH